MILEEKIKIKNLRLSGEIIYPTVLIENIQPDFLNLQVL